jgi:hypothetical protein
MQSRQQSRKLLLRSKRQTHNSLSLQTTTPNNEIKHDVLKSIQKLNRIKKQKGKKEAYVLSSSTGLAAATISPFAARFATTPSLVAGM